MTLPKMDSRIGLDYIVENRDYVSKLGAALDTNNTTVKKQVFELLSALCAYSREGYSRAIETLDHYKSIKNERYRFKVVVNELEKASSVEYQVALLAFVNCVIISAQCLQDRIRIRNEFIGLKVLPVLNNLRRSAHSVGDILVQLDVFDEQRECDEAQSLQGPNGINLNSHLDVFYAILRQVADTPQEIPFLSILQHLLRIDPKEAISDIIWDTAETLVHRATLLENREDSARLLRAPSVQKFTCSHCRGDTSSPSRKQSVVPTTPNSVQSPLGGTNFSIAVPPPPPPPPAAPPPPPPPMMINGNRGSGAPPAPPPPAPHLLHNNSPAHANRSKTPEPNFNDPIKLLPQQETPAPKTKMKTINWNKIPSNKVLGKRNIWAIVADSHQDSPMADLDWTEMEGLFCLQTNSNQGSPKLGRENGNDTLDRKSKKENSEISLLDGKRSLNVNIFLKQFRTSNEDIIQLIQDGEHDDIGAEKLRGLLKILPEIDELDMLRSFDGDKSRLGNAEKFLLQLLQVPNYKLRIESMLLKEEFAANVSYLEPCINAMLYAGDELINNKMLQEVLYMVVVAGNFLNSGGYAGNAAGVKLSSLQKLTDIRANKPGMNLIHFVALQAEKRNPNLLLFPDQMAALENASKTTSEQILNEINALDSRIRKIKKQVELPTTDSDIKEQMSEFLKAAEADVSILQRGMKEVDIMRMKLSDFFCEDPNTFKIEECFKIFLSFCEKFRQAVKENEKRRIQEEQATLRRKQREEQMAKRAKQLSQCGTPVSDPENGFILETTQFDVKCSPGMSRRRMGSFNTIGDQNISRDDGASPDTTPNGSLRRRRSRILSEEDEGSLMEFLRSSGHDNGNRERKASSYGSLDRSWARRARTGSAHKKRPDLLNIDFGADRERPSSPSPLAELNTAPVTEEPKPRISKEWRQKIESWLQANETDEKHNEDYKRRRRLASTRRSLETESESERNKLDPLPEEKTAHISSGNIETYKRVYPDWKPSEALENTDIVGTIEAIEDAQSYTRDKSAWRKSTLNVPNSSEEIESDIRRSKRHKVRDGVSSNSNSPLHSIQEEERRKSIIQKLAESPSIDRLQIYIRRPSDQIEKDDKPSTLRSPCDTNKQSVYIESKNNVDDYVKNQNSKGSDYLSSPNGDNIYGKRILETDVEKYNKVEIDSDNIETPPVTRRSLSNPLGKHLNGTIRSGAAPCRTESKKVEQTIDPPEKVDLVDPTKQDILGTGHFDRFSAARRTRRYKRPTDYSSANEDSVVNSNKMDNSLDNKREETKPKSKTLEDKDERLKRWQERLKSLEKYRSQNNSNQNNRKVVKLDKLGRHISSINQQDVQEAIRNLKSPTETPERLWSPPRELVQEKPSIKISNLELNDEGFEETQSLVSDTPSHGKESTSSCNEINEPRSVRIKPIRMTSTDSNTTTSSDASKTRNTSRSQIQSLLERNRQSFERSRSMRTPTPSNSTQSIIPRRTNSMRKTEMQSNTSSPSRRDVERSSSRTSLRSSRSSLNSSVSTSTVKKLPLKGQKTVSDYSLSKRPLATQNSSNNKTIVRVPASRSSSSGSSVGPSVRKPPPKSSLGSASFKENHQSKERMQSRTSTSNMSTSRMNISGIGNGSSSNQTSKASSRASSTTSTGTSSRLSGFMRPTASSTTKRQAADSKANK